MGEMFIDFTMNNYDRVNTYNKSLILKLTAKISASDDNVILKLI
jgi:hypothetical protein